MTTTEKIKHVIVEAIGDVVGKPGMWQEVTFTRTNAEKIADKIYEALLKNEYLKDA